MNRFLLGALAMGAVFVLTSFALTYAPPPKTGPAWTVSQYQLDRAFRLSLTLAGSGSPIVSQLPLTGGFIITQVRTAAFLDATIDVNGNSERFILNGTAGAPIASDLNPPIIARPGDVVTVTINGGGIAYTIAGYTTLPGET